MFLGSWAAGIQAGIGNVAAGSSFAVAQSVGAGAALPFIGFVGAAAIGAAAVGGGYMAVKKIREKKRKDLKLRPEQVDYLIGWMSRHMEYPVPTERELVDIFWETGLRKEQAEEWLESVSHGHRAILNMNGDVYRS